MIKEKIYDTVVEILTEKPETRDSDVKLAFVFYKVTEPDFYNSEQKQWDVLQFFAALENRKLPSLSSIGRARRLAQQNFPDLRGLKYEARQKKGTKKMKGFIVSQTHTDTVTRERQYHTDKLS